MINGVHYSATDGLTSSIGSDRYNQGWNQVFDGLVQFGKGQLKIGLQTPADFLLMNGFKMASAWQTANFFESAGRLLMGTERVILERIFANSVQYEAIRIKEGYAGFLSAGYDNGWKITHNNRAITIGNTIYMKDTAPNEWNEVLVHETTHVWQHQNGGTDYLSEAIYAQLTAGYGYGNDISKGKTWVMLNPEQQGQLIQDAYVNNFFTHQIWANSITHNGVMISAQDMTMYMRNVLPQLRSGMGAT